MMKLTSTNWIGLACGLLLAGSAVAETKIGVVDLKKVFEGYWRTGQADKQLKDRKAEFDRMLGNLEEDYKKSNEELKKLVEAANDQAVSSQERDKRKLDVEKKVADIREQENSIRNYRDTAGRELNTQMTRLRESVLREIRGTVEEKSKSAGYQLVFDVAAVSGNNTPVILYTVLSGTEVDITDSVLKSLNANAPADAPADDKKADDKKDDKKADSKK
jgi:outer membrane protein